MDHSSSPPVGVLVGMVGFYGLFIAIMIAASIFWIIALIDCVRREFEEPNEKIMWALIIVLTHGIGALIYWLVGRPRGRMAAR